MIAKGTTHNSGGRLAVYLVTGKAHETAELWQLRGFASDNIVEAFRSVHVIAAATRCEKPFFHVQVRTPDGEDLNREQWQRVADRIESKLGLSGQPRAIAFHRDNSTGHEHMHVAWSRIDDETMTAKNLPFFKLRLKEVCRELETELGITQVRNHRESSVLAPTRSEFEQARRLGIDGAQVRETIRECWEQADCGRAFNAALGAEGLTLAKGNRRDYVVLDEAGGIHALGMRILGCRAEQVRARLADLDQAKLLTVEEAREARADIRSISREAPDYPGGREWEDALAEASIAKEKIDGRFAEPNASGSTERDVDIDANAVLDRITRNRATFTSFDVAKEIGGEVTNWHARVHLANKLLDGADVVCLPSEETGRRYTTRAVLETEQEVLRATKSLRETTGYEVKVDLVKMDESLSAEQLAAVRHATGTHGLALIDGQAGTGKSHAMSAVRKAYECEGYSVIGLAPTNSVAQDMKEDGFVRARTIHSELYALDGGKMHWNSRTVVIVDEAAMIDTRRMEQLTSHAQSANAKLILVGDDRQLSSIEHGGMYGVLKERYGAAELTEVRRQEAASDRQASSLMAQGNFHEALRRYSDQGAIHWTSTESEARDALVAQWAKDSAADPSKSRFIFAYTNRDADELNAAVRDVRQRRGELGEGRKFETRHGESEFARGDRLQFTDTDKQRGIYNGQAGTVRSIEGTTVTVVLDGRSRRTVRFDAGEFTGFRHGYAGTIYKGQGRTFDQTYLYHSQHWRASSSYVALTRHRNKTEIFVARDTASGLNDLARQVSRTDDRRAASHFQPPLLDRIAEERPRSIDWRRAQNDPVYRLALRQLHESHQPTPSRSRSLGLER